MEDAGFFDSLLSGEFSMPDGFGEWLDGLISDHLREYDLAHDDTSDDCGEFD